jgi:hypothetical protein
MASKHSPKGGGFKDFTRPLLSVADASAYIEAALFDVLHNDELTTVEKHASLDALAHLARTLSGGWAHRLDGYGAAGERLFYRACGLDQDGGVPKYLRRRIGGGDV